MRDQHAERPDAANAFVKSLQQLYAFAVEHELTQRNPARDVPHPRSGSDGYHSWLIEEIRQFEECHPVGSKARLAFALLLCTGQRRSDVDRLGPKHVLDGWLTFTQAINMGFQTSVVVHSAAARVGGRHHRIIGW